jgi:uncharacterized membrane protein YtjA (UPF0391 family)
LIVGRLRHRLSGQGSGHTDKEETMLRYAVIFLIIAIIAAVLGFGGVAIISVEIAKILFFVFLVLFVITLVVHLFQGRRPPAPPL